MTTGKRGKGERNAGMGNEINKRYRLPKTLIINIIEQVPSLSEIQGDD